MEIFVLYAYVLTETIFIARLCLAVIFCNYVTMEGFLAYSWPSMSISHRTACSTLCSFPTMHIPFRATRRNLSPSCFTPLHSFTKKMALSTYLHYQRGRTDMQKIPVVFTGQFCSVERSTFMSGSDNSIDTVRIF